MRYLRWTNASTSDPYDPAGSAGPCCGKVDSDTSSGRDWILKEPDLHFPFCLCSYYALCDPLRFSSWPNTFFDILLPMRAMPERRKDPPSGVISGCE
jgi:hypothetical protein